ncbi:glycosyltransferase family 4 protein [Oceanihabitans sp.]|nr:glycosyltransferase family 4 protein [Oceanihabitans sp.]
MNKKKIAFILPSLKAGGAERVVSTLSNQLINTFDVVIVVLYNCTPFYPLDKRVEIHFCKEYSRTLSFTDSIRNHFDLMKRCKKYVKNAKADIIIGFTTTANIYSVLISKRIRLPSIISERIHPDYNIVNHFWNIIRKHIYPKSNALVVQTQEIMNYFLSFTDEKKVVIINNPLAEELVAQKNSVSLKVNHIICVGRLDLQKNQELLIRAFSNIKRKDWKLLLIGEGQLRSHYEKLIIDLNIEEYIELVGNIQDISKYYNTAKIFVLPSNFEGFPNALIEAMSFGLACIATNCPSGPSEIIKDNENGFLIPVHDQMELENKLQLLIDNSELQKQFSLKAIESTAIFDAAYIADKWKELIYKVLK